MGENSAIEWTDHTFNPWTGCTRVSPGCDNCYAAALAKRSPGAFGSWEPGAPRKLTSEAYWRQPLAWNRKAEREGKRARVFCASMADVFDNQVPVTWRNDLWDIIEQTPHLDWLLLTKRPQNIPTMLPYMGWAEPWANVWLGTTVENQAEADRRIPHLLKVPAAVRFLSCEPLLGAVDLSGWLPGDTGCVECDDGEGWGHRCSRKDIPREEQCPLNRAVFTETVGPMRDGMPEWVDARRETIDWVIAGGESGPGARPMHPDWARSLRDQCAGAGVPFFFKQWGDWGPLDPTRKARLRRLLAAHDYVNGPRVPVPAEDLREVLRELGELRQRTQQQARGILDAGNKALAENRSMGRVFANVAAATALRRCQRLEQSLTAIGGPEATKALFDDA